MKTITVNISDTAYRQLKEAAQREDVPLATFARPAIERAAYAASLAKFTPPGGGPAQYDAELLAEHDADVTRLVYGEDA